MGDWKGSSGPRALGRACLLIGLAVVPARGQTLRGRVVEAVTENAISGSAVQLVDPADLTVASGLTTATGAFVLQAPRPGQYTLKVASFGYATDAARPVTLPADRVTELHVRLAVAVIPLTPVSVEVERVRKLERAGFYERRRLGQGHFLERADIDQRQARTAGDLLRRVPGFRIVIQGYFTDVQSRSMGGIATCRPGIFVDGSLVSGPRRTASSFNLEDMQASDLEAIETYAGSATVPTQYNSSDTACGLILFWTRRPGA